MQYYKQQCKVLQNIKRNKNITILQTDKGNAPEYFEHRRVQYKGSRAVRRYQPISTELTTYLKEKNKINSSNILEADKNISFREKNIGCPKFYVLPKNTRTVYHYVQLLAQ